VSDLAVPGVAYAEANWGRWIAKCPGPWCDNAMGLERGQAVFVCAGPDSCGFTTDIVWPPDPAAIEMLLEMRPANKVRNWVPGETLENLIAENAVHGVLPPDLGPGTLAQIEDGRLVSGSLHLQLMSAARPQIGA
jgi:hypothetical protein